MIKSLKLEIEMLKKTVSKKDIELESTQFALDDGNPSSFSLFLSVFYSLSLSSLLLYFFHSLELVIRFLSFFLPYPFFFLLAIARLGAQQESANTSHINEEHGRQLKLKQMELEGAVAKMKELQQTVVRVHELEHHVSQLEEELVQANECGFVVKGELEKQRRIAGEQITVLKETLKSSEGEVAALDGLLVHVRDVLGRHTSSLTHPELAKLVWEVGSDEEATRDRLPISSSN